jgi:hypothetical protein
VALVQALTYSATTIKSQKVLRCIAVKPKSWSAHYM